MIINNIHHSGIGIVFIILLSCSCCHRNQPQVVKNDNTKRAYGHPSLIPLEKRKHWPAENGMLLIPTLEQIPDSEFFLLEKDSSEYAFNGRFHYVLKDTVFSFDAPCHFCKDSFYVEDFLYNISKHIIFKVTADKIEYKSENELKVINKKDYESGPVRLSSFDNIHQGLFGPYGEEYHSWEPVYPPNKKR